MNCGPLTKEGAVFIQIFALIKIKMNRKLQLLVFFFALGNFLFSQTPTLTENAKVSVITCASGDALYSAFGHTAFRVQDTALGIDVVYNYGTFDFEQPNFYLNFTKGKMIYSLSRRSFEAFLYEYELEKRWVKEQILDLTVAQRNQLLLFFEENYLPENRDYLYDPLLNNCSSITGDILKEQFGDAIVFDGSYLEKQYTFRQLVRQFLDMNSWSMFGIDLAFGSPVDRKATVQEHMFLPYYTMEQLRHTTFNGKPIVQRERTILDYNEHLQRGFFPLSPLFWFILLLAFTGIITYFDFKHKARSRWLDFSLLFITGLAGTFLFLLWVAADHTSTPYNYNILWAFPINLIVSFTLLFQDKVPQWSPKYFMFALGLMAIMLLLWILRVQIFSPVLIPLLLTLAIRYVYLIRYSKL